MRLKILKDWILKKYSIIIIKKLDTFRTRGSDFHNVS